MTGQTRDLDGLTVEQLKVIIRDLETALAEKTQAHSKLWLTYNKMRDNRMIAHKAIEDIEHRLEEYREDIRK